MASAIDSGVDTGNDSNDSSLHDKLSKMDLGIESELKQPSDSSKDTSSEEVGNSNETQSYSCSSSNKDTIREASFNLSIMEGAAGGMSLTHLQPSSLMHGYEYVPPSTSPHNHARNSNQLLLKIMNSKDIGGVFVSGGPFGTEYKASELMTKVNRLRQASQLGGLVRRKCLNSYFPYHHNLTKLSDARRMCRAACHNNIEAMSDMLRSGLSPNCHDAFKRSPLHLAACMGYADMVKLLLDYGADPNAKDSIGNTPLHLAACTNHVKVITLLLKAGTRVSEPDMVGHSPLQLAITKFNIMKRSILPHPVLKEQVFQVITMLTEYMKRKEGTTLEPDMLNKFESLVRVSDSAEEVESNIQDILNNLGSLSLSGTS